ncbi:MAG: hypothetical protein H7338_19310 [Candidatus Sericytochromatia bacterium]|nr:hypothetical protein [Candidatus Sericytochromatia bacterium]
MHASAHGQGGLRLAAITGLDTAVVAWDVPEPASRGGLQGFTAFLVDSQKGKGWFLKNHRDNGSSHRCPIQRFRWTIYGLRPGAGYTLYVWPVFEGTGPVPIEGPSSDRRGPMPTEASLARAGRLEFRTETNDQRLIQIQTNRGTYAMPSPPRLAGNEGEEGERRFLGRGLEEFIAGFVVFAGSDDREPSILAHAVDEPVIGEAISSIKHMRLLVDEHAPANDGSDVLKQMRKVRRKAFQVRTKQDTTYFSTQNAVIARGESGNPVAVLISSADFSAEGIYAQANHAMVIADPGVAAAFQERFDALWGPDDAPGVSDRKAVKASAASKGFIELDVQDGDETVPVALTFAPHTWSPRAKSGMDFNRVAAMIGEARHGVFFAQSLLDDVVISKALKDAAGRGVPVYGLIDRVNDSTDPDTIGFVSPATIDRTDAATLTETAALAPEGFPAWSGTPEVRVHHQVMVIDPGTPEAVTISSSGAFTAAASKLDDNHLLIIRNQRVADIFFAEIIRLYDTYRYRYLIGPDGGAHNARRPKPWWQHAYEGPGIPAREQFLPLAKEQRPGAGLSGRERRAAIRKKYTVMVAGLAAAATADK